MKITVKNMPRLRLADLLRRRKMNLRQFLDEFGITTYEGLAGRCARMGVLTPPETDFREAFPAPPINSPQEGVVVLDAPPVVDELSGRQIDPDAPVMPEVRVLTEPLADSSAYVLAKSSEEPTEAHQKKQRKKKETKPPTR